MTGSYLEMRHTHLMPEMCMLEELARFFTDLSAERLDSSSVFHLIQDSKEELHVACCVNEVSTGALIVWFPYLNRHGFGENLLCELVLCCQCSHTIIRRPVIDRPGRLSQFSNKPT